MTVAPPKNQLKDNRSLGQSRRLSFFVVITDINYKTNNCNDQRAKEKQCFPCDVHCYHLPPMRKATKRI